MNEWKAKDGAVDIGSYNSEKTKILWILREPNGKDFDFLEYLSDPRVYPRWKSTYGLVVKTSDAIFNGAKDKPDYPYPKDIPALMKRIALVNIKKTGGKSSSIPEEIMEYAKNNKEEMKEQLRELSPDVIILAGTDWYFLTEIRLHIREITGKDTKIISASHPNQRKIKHGDYIGNILREFRSVGCGEERTASIA